MHWTSFISPSTRNISLIYIIFNMKHATAGLNTIYKFQCIRRIFTRTRSRTDGQTTNRNHKYCSTLMESIKEEKECFQSIAEVPPRKISNG